MICEKATHLQRIGEGLPVLARVENGILQLAPPNHPDQTWAEFPTEGCAVGEQAGGYDATLEAFRKGERIGSETILERGIARILDDPEIAARLVLNHREDGNPLVKPDWRALGIAVVLRPTLARSEGKSSWMLARSLPCSEIRVYRKEADGSWTVEKEVRASPESESEAKRADESKIDRYAAICRGIPVRPIAKPFSIRSVGRPEKEAAMRSYRM